MNKYVNLNSENLYVLQEQNTYIFFNSYKYKKDTQL